MNKTEFIEKVVEENNKVYEVDKGNYHFLKVENHKGGVLTIAIPTEREYEYEGVEITTPIMPNMKTGSSVGITGSDNLTSFEKALEIIKDYLPNMPNFFSAEDKEVTKFLIIEQSVNMHHNILGFNKIK